MRLSYLIQIYNIAKDSFQYPVFVFFLVIIGTTYIIKNNKKIKGYAIRFGSYLHFLAVDKKCRGKGIGRKVIKKALPNIRTLRVHVDNKKAIQLYISLGFQIISTDRRFTGLQHLMKR